MGGHGVLPLATGKKYEKLTKPSESWLTTLLAHFPLSLEISFYADLGAPKRQHRTISRESAKTCCTVKFKDGGDPVSDRNRFNRQFSLNDPLTRFVRESQHHYSKLALLTSDDLLLVRLLKASYYSVVFSPCFLVNSVYRSSCCVHHGCSSGLLDTHATTSHYTFNNTLYISVFFHGYIWFVCVIFQIKQTTEKKTLECWKYKKPFEGNYSCTTR